MKDEKEEVWNESKGKDQLIKRMVKAYRKNKRKEKIEKLASDEDHWKGLQ